MVHLKYVLASVFSTNFALSPDEITRFLENIGTRVDDRAKKGLYVELTALYGDPDADWVALLSNETVKAYQADNQEDAKRFVTQRIWNVVFPDQPR